METAAAVIAPLLAEHGIAEHADAIVPTARPCAHLVAVDDGDGRSRFLGDPDLPVGHAWPTDTAGDPLLFVLQVELSAIPAEVRGPLPAAGLLSLFAGLMEPATDVPVHVLVVPDDVPLVTTPGPAVVDDVLTVHGETCGLAVVPGWDLPRWATDDHHAIAEHLTDEQADALEKVTAALEPPGRGTLGRLFGHAAGIGHDPRHDAHVVRDVDPALLYDYEARSRLDPAAALAWEHLITLDSCDAVDLLIWDAGYLQVLVRGDDLRELRLDRAYAAVESS